MNLKSIFEFDVFGWFKRIREIVEFTQSQIQRSATQKKEKYREVYRPIYDRIEKCHSEYMAFLSDADRALSELGETATKNEATFKILRDLKYTRFENWHVRVALRSDTLALMSLATCSYERSFSCAVIGYFVEPEELAIKADDYVAEYADSLVENKGESIIRSPTHMIDDLPDDISADDLRKIIVNLKKKLSNAWAVVSNKHSELKYVVENI